MFKFGTYFIMVAVMVYAFAWIKGYHNGSQKGAIVSALDASEIGRMSQFDAAVKEFKESLR